MLEGAGLGGAKDPAEALRDGSAMDVWRRMIRAQGGDPDAALPVAPESHEVLAPASGHVTRLDAYGVGVASWRLGAGRSRKEDPVSATAGVTLHAKPGDRVREGEPLLTLHADEADRFARALEALQGAYDISEEPPAPQPLIIDRIA
jgi:thymidine phosphorylase